MTILVVGMAVIDFVFEVESLPRTAEKYTAHGAQVVGGGGAANAACAIARLGGKVQLASRVGDDEIGAQIIAGLKKQSVDCSLTSVSTDAQSSYSAVFVDAAGERQIVNFRGHNLTDEVASISRATATAVLADTRWVAGTKAAFHRARSLSVPAVLDAEAPIDNELMTLATHIAFSRQGLESVVGTLNNTDDVLRGLQFVQREHSAWVAVTDGAYGTFFLHENKLQHCPAISVNAIDTLGAGDVWHGTFVYAIANGIGESEAVKLSNAVASLKCTRSGGGRMSPQTDEVVRFLAQHDLPVPAFLN